MRWIFISTMFLGTGLLKPKSRGNCIQVDKNRSLETTNKKKNEKEVKTWALKPRGRTRVSPPRSPCKKSTSDQPFSNRQAAISTPDPLLGAKVQHYNSNGCLAGINLLFLLTLIGFFQTRILYNIYLKNFLQTGDLCFHRKSSLGLVCSIKVPPKVQLRACYVW